MTVEKLSIQRCSSCKSEISQDKMGSKDWCHVNRRLLPFKLHFFFYFGALAGVAPFLPLIAKQIGINATAVGVAFSAIPVITLLSNPLLGLLVDYFQNLKLFMIALLITGSISYFSVLFIPSIDSPFHQNTYIQIANSDTSKLPIKIPLSYEKTCLDELIHNEIDCRLIFDNDTSCSTLNSIQVVHNKTLSKHINKSSEEMHWITFNVRDAIDERCFYNASAEFQCEPTIRLCLSNKDYTSVFYTYQFWTFISLVVIGRIGTVSINALSSASTFEVLDKNTELYGRQRLFGTISWGLVCSLAGLFNDIFGHGERSFAPGLYLMAVCFAIDIAIICLIQMPKANYSKNMCSDLKKIITSIEIVSFAIGVIVVGILNSIVILYEFWFLQDMGASQFLLGLTMGVSCFVGELPCMFFSGYIEKKLGHFLCMVSVFAGLMLQLALYSILTDPWLVLPIDILHGLTFAISHTTMASYAKIKAPKGMEATLQSMFGGLYYGLGTGIGSFFGGIGLDVLGPRKMFSYASILSGVTLFLFLVESYCFRGQTRQRRASIKMEPLPVDDT